MDTTFKLILDKLTTIESRLGKLEKRPADEVSEEIPQAKDALFKKALVIAEKYEEVPASLLQKELSIDEKRANLLLDQLEEAGYGSCYFGEAS